MSDEKLNCKNSSLNDLQEAYSNVSFLLNYDSDDDKCSSKSDDEDYNSVDKAGQNNIPLIPFNMKEELEEGYFDTEGTYHWKKDSDNVKDNWLENINWNILGTYSTKTSVNNCNSSDSEVFNCVDIYKKILKYLKPKETISKALCRLGRKNTLTTAEKWKLKKLGKTVQNNLENSQKITELTGLANCVLKNTGNVNIYEETYEDFIKIISNYGKSDASSSDPVKKHSVMLDMYSDDFLEKEKSVINGISN